MNETKRAFNYILNTPVKNEEKYLPNLILSITNQTVKPVLWIIADDGSTDNTPRIIKEAKEKYDWIQSIHLEESPRDARVHMIKVMRSGIDFAYKYCKENGLDFDYLGNVDADFELENIYFESLLKKFNESKQLGVASGCEVVIEGDKKKEPRLRYPAGGHILYRRKCFEDCGGVPQSGLWDSVLNTKAMMKEWEIKRFDNGKAFTTRDYTHADKLWKDYKKIGERYYFMNYNLLYAMLKGFKLSLKKPYYLGLAYSYGYLSSLALRREQINDEEVRNYFWNSRPREIKQYYLGLLKDKLKKMI